MEAKFNCVNAKVATINTFFYELITAILLRFVIHSELYSIQYVRHIALYLTLRIILAIMFERNNLSALVHPC
jgi:hypothetical protein